MHTHIYIYIYIYAHTLLFSYLFSFCILYLFCAFLDCYLFLFAPSTSFADVCASTIAL